MMMMMNKKNRKKSCLWRRRDAVWYTSSLFSVYNEVMIYLQMFTFLKVIRPKGSVWALHVSENLNSLPSKITNMKYETLPDGKMYTFCLELHIYNARTKSFQLSFIMFMSGFDSGSFFQLTNRTFSYIDESKTGFLLTSPIHWQA